MARAYRDFVARATVRRRFGMNGPLVSVPSFDGVVDAGMIG